MGKVYYSTPWKYGNAQYHYGVLGMKWGVRNSSYSIGNGLTLERKKMSLLGKGLRKISPKIAKEQDKSYSSNIKAGKKISSNDDSWGGLTTMKKKLK